MKGTVHWVAQWGSPIQIWSIYLISSGKRRHPVWKHGEFQHNDQFSSVRFSCPVPSDTVTPWIAEHQASLSLTNSRSLLKLMSVQSVRPSNHLILCCPLLLWPPIESVLCMRWPKYWSFSFSISPSNEHPGLISFMMDWLVLLAVQGILNSLRQHQSSKASIFWHSAFFTVQLTHPYMTTGKSIGAPPTFLEWSWHLISSLLSLSLSHPHTQSFIRALALWCPLQGRLKSLRMETEGWRRMCHQMLQKHLNTISAQHNTMYYG